MPEPAESTPIIEPAVRTDGSGTSAEIADVLVVGAGPAGTAAAIAACRDGRSVVMVDKATFPGTSAAGTG
ncbi:MAG: FAD-dependent oxidoreductase [Ilumatobacteraceae bacterium]